MISDVEAMSWTDFQDWFSRAWVPGDHVALVGPTGTGKTTFACGILPLRKYVLAMDAKGGDSTLKALQKYGFHRSGWPLSRKDRKTIDNGEPLRLIIGSVVKERKDLPKLRATLANALNEAFDEKNWTIYLDELQLMADRRMMGLGGSIETYLIAARDRKVSVVSSFQRPANVPRSASDQAAWMAVWYTRDIDVVNRISEMVGRPRAEIRGAVGALEKYAVLLFSRDPSEPIRLIRPPKS